MKNPIPKDWNGQSWQCVQVQWPNSREYTGLLLGFLSYLTRGRAWDETSGNIQDVQKIAWMIWDRNYPLVDCTGETVKNSPGFGEISDCGFGCDDCEGDMSCITDLKIEDGILWMQKGCCEWIAVGSIAQGAASEDIPPETFNDPVTGDPPAGGFSACGKAWGVVDAIFQAIDAIWDTLDDNPLNAVSGVHSRLPGVQVSTGGIIGCWFLAKAASTAGADNPFLDEALRQDVLCRFAKLFHDDSEGVTEDVFNEMQGMSLAGLALQRDPLVLGLIHDIIKAIGRGDLNKIAMSGATDITRDCECGASNAPRPTDPADVIYDVLASLTPVTIEGTKRHMALTHSSARLWEDADHDGNAEELHALDIDPDVALPVSAGNLLVFIKTEKSDIEPASEVWMQLGINVHHGVDDTVFTARFQGGLVGSYTLIQIGPVPEGEITSVFIDGKLWTNEGDLNEFKVSDWYIAIPAT